MLFVFAIALIDFFSFSMQMSCFSKSAPSSSSWFVCVIIECKIQNAEVMDITDTTRSLLLISAELMQQDTADHLERPVRSNTYAHIRSGMNSKSAELLNW